MQFIYDHLSAAIVGTGVFLLLVAVQRIGTETTVDGQFFAAARGQMQGFVDVLDEDLNNVGAGVPAMLDAVVAYDSTGSDGTGRLAFRRVLDIADSTFAEIEYRWAVVDTVAFEEGGVVTARPLFEVQRFVDGAASGRSPRTLLGLVIEPRTAGGAPASPVSATTAIYTRFDVLYTQEETVRDQTARRTRWARTYRPANLN